VTVALCSKFAADKLEVGLTYSNGQKLALLIDGKIVEASTAKKIAALLMKLDPQKSLNTLTQIFVQ
jgi:hypothetical protein